MRFFQLLMFVTATSFKVLSNEDNNGTSFKLAPQDELNVEQRGLFDIVSRSGSRGTTVKKDLTKFHTENLDYVFELASEKLLRKRPIWLQIENSLLPRIDRRRRPVRKNCSVSNSPNCVNAQTPVVESTLTETIASTIWEQLPSALSNFEFSESLLPEISRVIQGENVASLLTLETADQLEETRARKRGKKKKKQKREEVVSLESGNVAALPVRISRDGKLELKKLRGFITGVVPFRVAPIKLVPATNLRQKPKMIAALNAKARFNFFEESEELYPEIYLMTMSPQNEFKLSLSNRRRGRRGIPKRLRKRLTAQLKANSLKEHVRREIMSVLRKVLEEENNKGSFLYK